MMTQLVNRPKRVAAEVALNKIHNQYDLNIIKLRRSETTKIFENMYDLAANTQTILKDSTNVQKRNFSSVSKLNLKTKKHSNPFIIIDQENLKTGQKKKSKGKTKVLNTSNKGITKKSSAINKTNSIPYSGVIDKDNICDLETSSQKILNISALGINSEKLFKAKVVLQRIDFSQLTSNDVMIKFPDCINKKKCHYDTKITNQIKSNVNIFNAKVVLKRLRIDNDSLNEKQSATSAVLESLPPPYENIKVKNQIKTNRKLFDAKVLLTKIEINKPNQETSMAYEKLTDADLIGVDISQCASDSVLEIDDLTQTMSESFVNSCLNYSPNANKPDVLSFSQQLSESVFYNNISETTISDVFESMSCNESFNNEYSPTKDYLKHPDWSEDLYSKMIWQARASTVLVDLLFNVKESTPNLSEIFPGISKEKLHRNSSALWTTLPSFSLD